MWGGLWEFPGGQVSEGEPGEMVEEKILEDIGLSVAVVRLLTSVTHQYTHHKINLHCFLCDLTGTKAEPILGSASNYLWISPQELKKFAFPAGPRKVIEYIRSNEPNLLSSYSLD